MLKNLLRPIITWLRYQREIFLDGLRHFRNTPRPGYKALHEQAQLEGDIIRRYHVLEKGLSMPEFRPRFGQPIVEQLVEMVNRWDLRHPCQQSPNEQVEAARHALTAYLARHESLGVDVSEMFTGFQPTGLSVAAANGGVRSYTPASPADLDALKRMLHARCSIRNYDTSLTPEHDAIERAVATAIQTPSVCNRQTWRAHLYLKEDAQKILALQNGNRGFGHTIPAVFVVTSDLRYFGCLSERYQSWVDGGMFGMSLLLGLQAEGFGAVALNWCVMNRQDQQLRLAAEIPDFERIIMIIGFGDPAQDCQLPISQRRPVSNVLRVHSSTTSR